MPISCSVDAEPAWCNAVRDEIRNASQACAMGCGFGGRRHSHVACSDHAGKHFFIEMDGRCTTRRNNVSYIP